MGSLLRVIDLSTGQMIPTRSERAQSLRAEVSRLRQLLGLPDED